MRHYVNYLAIGFVSLAAAVLLTALLASSSQAACRHTPVGTWSVKVTFTSGSMKGTTQQGSFTFNPDGTLSERTGPYCGTGTWQTTGHTTFQVSFDEPSGSGYIHVDETATFHGPNAYTANGTGGFYIGGIEVPGSGSTSTTTATRTS